MAGKRQLIIVVDDSTKQYGELLLALTMMRDDVLDEEGNYTDSGRVGTRDGSVDAVVWDEKHYIDNQYKLGSAARVIFIGDLKSAKPIAANIICSNEFSKYGVLYGSLGNKAIVSIDKKKLVSNKKEYTEFVKDYSDFLLSVSQEFADTYKISEAEFYSDKFNKKAKTIQESIDQGAKGVAQSVESVVEILSGKKDDNAEETAALVIKEEQKERITVSGVAAKVIAAMVTPIDSVGGVKAGIAIAQSNAEIVDQQYRCGIIQFYIDELESFLG